ncbi:MAG: UDP-3-O-(3-hydroxymyristoyl)glucosamine N-acyltransferase [Bacteroidetes bacterium HGW-Bacteroidetes-21]|nr:MAG: UDP-3-O-(3-hydroxymyristoyl)glucosamine N-acyltransferase [Bacteroidetes bacterium HGW-Bacteroidetes-21]
MYFPQTHTLHDIAEWLGNEYAGKGDLILNGINEIHRVEKGQITFADHPKYYQKALYSAATVVLVNAKLDCPQGKGLIFSQDPFRDFNRLTARFNTFSPGTNTVSPTAEIGHGTVIQPNAFIGDNVVIGKNCLIHSNVSIYHNCIIGNNVIIHANTVIGSDAFYYKRRPEGYDKLLSGGRVIIQDFVEIGSNCSIDRGVTSDTIIGEGTKLDNLIQIGHDTIIGKDCLFASQVGVAGCVNIEDNVILWGQVGVQKDLTIGAGSVVLGQSGIAKSMEGGKVYFGSPASDSREKMRELAYIKRLPELIKILTEKL